jgi:MoxR-like ATPase
MTLDEVRDGVRAARYVTTPRVETALYLALTLGKPLLAEGPAGAGKTELAHVLAHMLDTELVRLQCYEGLDEARALFEWNYQKQLLRIQADRTEGRAWNDVAHDVFSRDFLLERPLLRAITAPARVVLLIDEIDKADAEFEAFLLEVLSDFQVSIPELGTLKARHIPLVVLTSNNARELSDGLKRRCLHLFIDFPAPADELEIIRLKVPEAPEQLARAVVAAVQKIRTLELRKPPSVSESIDWARSLVILNAKALDPALVESTLTMLVKYEKDIERVKGALDKVLADTPA